MISGISTSLAAAIVIGIGACAAARAQAPGTNPPGVNPAHYQCYKATGAFHPAPVKLHDQFGAYPTVRVLQPVYLCTPVGKNDEAIGDERTHLVCYTDTGVKPPNKAVRVTNQFGVQTLKVATPALLCVPSLKQVLQ